tara:strand:+ start:114 stop:539 length:426 start_codon:yes stop_codon:yes gene_type:complete
MTTYKIYKLTNNLNDLVYYGITKQKYLSQRLSGHRNCRSETSKLLFKNGAIVKIHLIQHTTDKKREAFYIKNFPCVNKCQPYRTQKEYYNDNKIAIQEKIKKYKEENYEKISKWQKDNYKIKKDFYNQNRKIKYALKKLKK